MSLLHFVIIIGIQRRQQRPQRQRRQQRPQRQRRQQRQRQRRQQQPQHKILCAITKILNRKSV